MSCAHSRVGKFREGRARSRIADAAEFARIYTSSEGRAKATHYDKALGLLPYCLGISHVHRETLDLLAPPIQERIRRLESELEEARSAVIELVPENVRGLLRSYADCTSREETEDWLDRIAREAMAFVHALPAGVRSSSANRGYCPLRGVGSQSSFAHERGFSLPEGLRRHLVGFGNVRQCVVTRAAGHLARAWWGREFPLDRTRATGETPLPLVALVRPPTAALADGERTYVDRQPIDFAQAQEQHINYVVALRDAGAQIVALPPIASLADAVFIEDTALVLDSLAVMAHSAAKSRRAEAATVAGALSNYCYLAHLPEGACFDGGDALIIERTVYLGLTQRTNQAAIDFLKTLLRQYHYDAVAVPVSGCLHLKTAVTSLGENMVLINPQWVPREAFAKHLQIEVAMGEAMGGNALRVGNRLLMSASYPQTAKRIEAHGLIPRLVDVGEFHKAEGGLTCLSILLQAP